MDIGAGLGVSEQRDLGRVRQIDFYVDAALGSDWNSGTFDSPFRTFQHAVNMADESNNPGYNNIFLRPGTYGGASIYDEDLLKVFGTGLDPWDVNIQGDSMDGDGIHIGGGSDVRLYNLQTYGSSGNGIYAQNVDLVFLKNVVSWGHGGSGFYGNDIGKTKIYHSTLTNNGEFGAYLNGGNIFRSSHSMFDSNGNIGAGVQSVASAQMVFSTASSNRGEYDDFESVARAAFSFRPGSGFAATNVDEVLVNGGYFNQNYEDGISVEDANNVKLLGVTAHGNQDEGAHIGFYGLAESYGGHYSSNGDHGLHFDAGKPREDDSMQPRAEVYGGFFQSNDESGVAFDYTASALLVGVDARNNYNGIRGESYGTVHVAGGYLYGNRDDGIDLMYLNYAQINDLVANHNGDDGVDFSDGDRLNILGGTMIGNEDLGLQVLGDERQPIQRVDVKYATVLNNAEGGALVRHAYLGKFVGGDYSHNGDDGIYMRYVTRGMFEYVAATNNQGNGVRYDAGRMDFEPDAAIARDDHGSWNWNHVEMLGGLYQHNNEHGIYLRSDDSFGRDYSTNQLEVDAQYVVSRDNAYAGLYIDGYQGDVPTIEANGYGYGSNLQLDMLGGYYSHNGWDGIYLLGDGEPDPDPGFSGGALAARLIDVVAEFNGGAGVSGGGRTDISADSYYSEIVGHENQYSLVNFQRGYYGFNGNDGIRLRLVGAVENGDVPLGAAGNHYAVATFDHVAATFNGGSGIWLEGIVDSHGDGDEAVDFARAADHGDGDVLVGVWGGVFNENENSGLNFSVYSFGGFERDGHAYSPSVVLHNVIANANENNGLQMWSDGFLRPNVHIQAGVFNVNGNDGMHLVRLGDVRIDQATIVANHDDGLDAISNLDVLLTNNTIHSNFDENVSIV